MVQNITQWISLKITIFAIFGNFAKNVNLQSALKFFGKKRKALRNILDLGAVAYFSSTL